MIYERFAPTLCQGSQRTFFFLYILHAVQNQTKIFIKITFKKLIHNLFLLHYIYLDTIHTNVCIVHYKMWFLCKVWFPYQTALEIQRICEDIFNDINTYVFVLWYNKQEKQILYDVFVLQMHPHRDLESHTVHFFPSEIMVSFSVRIINTNLFYKLFSNF